jgi:hypothetical protein
VSVFSFLPIPISFPAIDPHLFRKDSDMRLLSTLAVLFVSSALCVGQEGAFSAAQFDKVVKNDLKLEFEKKSKGNKHLYDLKGTPYYVVFDGDQKFIQFFETHPFKNAPLDKLNAWNTNAIYSRVYAPNAEAVKFEVILGIAAGTTPAQVKSYYENFEKEFNEFKDFLK